ncbi:hypothetical protein SARC_14920, partial [Sphaeroforma arctica JP610]
DKEGQKADGKTTDTSTDPTNGHRKKPTAQDSAPTRSKHKRTHSSHKETGDAKQAGGGSTDALRMLSLGANMSGGHGMVGEGLLWAACS